MTTGPTPAHIMTLLGLRSRWITPLAWAASSACASLVTISTALRGGWAVPA